MKDFKFFGDNDEDEIESFHGASWMFVNVDNLIQYSYDIVVDHHQGIHSFLSQFPEYHIVSIISITGPDGLEHNITNEGIGWGFDITRDVITVRYVRFREN